MKYQLRINNHTKIQGIFFIVFLIFLFFVFLEEDIKSRKENDIWQEIEY